MRWDPPQRRISFYFTRKFEILLWWRISFDFTRKDVILLWWRIPFDFKSRDEILLWRRITFERPTAKSSEQRAVLGARFMCLINGSTSVESFFAVDSSFKWLTLTKGPLPKNEPTKGPLPWLTEMSVSRFWWTGEPMAGSKISVGYQDPFSYREARCFDWWKYQYPDFDDWTGVPTREMSTPRLLCTGLYKRKKCQCPDWFSGLC